MTLQNGTRLGPYEIVAPIGAGGMGEVYHARDTRLGRSVAIKIIPSGFSTDSRLRVRFEREAKAISALNHPHICTLHDVGHDNGVDYLVLEHCQGKTLARVIADGPLPVRQVFEYAIQIADALDKAHRQGIVHRDLKPSNIMITRSGVKVLDFGLAKDSGNLSADDSTVAQVSEEGTILGTVPYMAPEVLGGKPADARSDLFAFGLMAYEMLTGQRAFAAPSRAGLIAAILEHEPRPLSEVRSDVPLMLQKIISACLAKDPDERLQSAHDVMLQLEWTTDASVDAKTPRRLLWPVAAALFGVLALAAAIAIAIINRKTEPPPAGVRRLALTLPADAAVASGISGNPLALSPDGKRLVYVGPQQTLNVRHLDRAGVEVLAGSEGASNPFFSPDGKWIGFEARGTLKKIAFAGGLPMTICDGATVRGAVWGTDDVITYAQAGETLMRVHASGGTPEPLQGTNFARWPAALPNTDALLVTRYDPSGDPTRNEIALFTPRDARFETLLRTASHAQYSPAGYLLFLRAGSVYRVGFDPRTRKLIGTPEPILNNVDIFPAQGVAYVVIGERTLYFTEQDPANFQRQLVWVDRRGQFVPAADKLQAYGLSGANLRLSPDGKQALVDICIPGECDLWRYEIERATFNRVTSDGRSANGVWSPDGRSIAYSSNRKGPYNIFIVPSDGSDQPRQLTKVSSWAFPNSWSPDGTTLAILDGNPTTAGDVWLLPTGAGKATPYLRSAAMEADAAFSPDGRWIAYTSAQSGKPEVYIRAANGTGAALRVSTDGGSTPVWRRDGKELFYRRDRAVMAASITLSGDVSAGKPFLLFEGPFSTAFDVTPDGERFLMIRRQQLSPRTQITVVEGLLE